MKQRFTFRAHARNGRARKKLMNFTGTGASEHALKALKEKTDNEKTAQNRGYWGRFGRGLVGLYDDPQAAELWQMQVQQFARQLAQEQGISAEQALPMAMQQMRQSGMTPRSLQQEMLSTDISNRSGLTNQIQHWLNPVFNPVLYPGYTLAESALQASGVGGSGTGVQLARGLAPAGAQTALWGLGKFGLPGATRASRLLGQVPLSPLGTTMNTAGKVVAKGLGKFGLPGAARASSRLMNTAGKAVAKGAGRFLLPAYMAAMTASDPLGGGSLISQYFTGKPMAEYNRILNAQAMRDVLGGKKMKDTWFGSGVQQLTGAALRPVAYAHSALPLGDAPAAFAAAGGKSIPTLSDWLQEQSTAGANVGERQAIRGGLMPGAADLGAAALVSMTPASAVAIPYLLTQMGLKAYSKYGIGDVSGYDPFYRQRWAADRAARQLDAQRRQMFRSQLEEATGSSFGDPEAQSNRLWLNQMKRLGELSPYGAESTWTRDPITGSYKSTDEVQTEVDPSQSVWQRSLADAQRLAKERGMSVEQVLMGRDARAAAADEQNARQFLAKAKAVESGNVQGMDPTEVQRIQNFVANTKAQGLPINEQTAKGFVMQRRRQADLQQSEMAGEKPGMQDVGRHSGYSWWKQQLAEGKGYNPYEALSARADIGKGFDKNLFDQLVTDEDIELIRKSRPYQHYQSGIRGAFSGAQLEHFLAGKSPHELQRVHGMSGRQMRELHQANRQDYIDMMNLANRRLATGAGREQPVPKLETAKATIPTATNAGSSTYLPAAKKKNTGGGIAAAPQNASGKGDGSRV